MEFVIFVAAAIGIVLIDRWLDGWQERHDARRRNQAHPWKR